MLTLRFHYRLISRPNLVITLKNTNGMENKKVLNYIALHQNIFGKSTVEEARLPKNAGTKSLKRKLGIPVYINGITPMPRTAPLNSIFNIAKIRHPYAMSGTPEIPALLTYEFGVSVDSYSLIIRLLLLDGEKEPQNEAASFAAVILRKDINPPKDSTANHALFLSEMLQLHFHQLFAQFDDINGLKDWEIEQGLFSEILQIYFADKTKVANAYKRYKVENY